MKARGEQSKVINFINFTTVKRYQRLETEIIGKSDFNYYYLIITVEGKSQYFGNMKEVDLRTTFSFSIVEV